LLRSDKRGLNLISDALPFGGLWYGEPDAISNAIGYAKFYSRSHNAEIRIFDEHQQRRSAIANARTRAAIHFSPSCHTPFQSLPGGFRRNAWMR